MKTDCSRNYPCFLPDIVQKPFGGVCFFFGGGEGRGSFIKAVSSAMRKGLGQRKLQESWLLWLTGESEIRGVAMGSGGELGQAAAAHGSPVASRLGSLRV